MNYKLIDEYPLLVLPTLACALGLNEAIVVQQIHFWLQNPKVGKKINGRKWMNNTYDEWKRDNFKFWSIPTIRRAFDALREQGYIDASPEFNANPHDRTLWYTVNYEKVDEVVNKWVKEHPDPDDETSDQVDHMDVPKLITSIGSDRSHDLTETTQRLPDNSGYAVPKVRMAYDPSPKVIEGEKKDRAKEEVDQALHPLERRVAAALHQKSIGVKIRELLASKVDLKVAPHLAPSPIEMWETRPEFADYVDARILYWLSLDKSEGTHLVRLIRQYDMPQHGWFDYLASFKSSTDQHSPDDTPIADGNY
jgi:hypothetical protein